MIQVDSSSGQPAHKTQYPDRRADCVAACSRENSADEQRVVSDVRPKQKRLFWSGAVQRDEDVGDVLLGQMMCLIRNLQPARVRKGLEHRRDVVAELSVADSALLQNVPGQNIKIKLR